MTHQVDGWTYPELVRPRSFHVLQRAAACPTCGAPEGAYCKSRTGRPKLTSDSHFARQRAAMGEPLPTDADRFWIKVIKTESCWLWLSGNNGVGYGKFYLDGTMVLAHRWAYEDARGPIPAGHHLDHLCRVRHCVNPAHLEPVTSRENTMRGKASFDFSGMCLAGLHDVTDESNVYVRPDGKRQCKPCIRAGRARYYREHEAPGVAS